MTEQAWPFLIGRTHDEDHRLVVAPRFMAGGPQAAELRRLATGEPRPSGQAYLRELASPSGAPVSIVYRVSMPARADFGLAGNAPLTDEYGRPIRMTEGIVLRRPAREVAAAGVGQADLDCAHDAVVPAYLDFWARGRHFKCAASASFPVAGPGTVPVTLVPEAAVPAITAIPARPASPARPRPRRRGLQAGAAVAGLAVIVAVAAGAGLWLSKAGPRAPTPAAALAQVCGDLLAGRAGAAYGLATSAYRHDVSGLRFAARLLPPGGGPAISCTAWLEPGAPRGTARGTLVVAQRRGPAAFWLVRLAGAPGRWQLAGLTRL